MRVTVFGVSPQHSAWISRQGCVATKPDNEYAVPYNSNLNSKEYELGFGAQFKLSPPSAA